MSEVLVVVDMQRDFIDGVLGTREACAIVPTVIRTIEQFDGPVFYTMDTHDEHYLSTEEGRQLPVVHCIEETPGWQLNSDVAEALARRHAVGVRKPTFGSIALMEAVKAAHPTAITMVGVCTDICVVTNALLAKTYFPEVPVTVIASACAASTPEKQQQTLTVMQSCQIMIEE